nr:hypothetical protein BaRGS_014919 [Batillaria attramentaria]
MFCFRKSPQQTFQLLIHVNSYLGFPVDSAEGKTEDSYVQTVVALLTVVHDSGVYNVAADRARGGAQLKYFRRMLQVLLKAEISSSLCRCLSVLLHLNHLILEPTMKQVLHFCCSQLTQLPVETRSSVDVFLSSLVSTYSQLHQVPKWFGFVLDLNAVAPQQLPSVLSLPAFRQQLHEVIQQLPQTTAVDVWSRLSSEVTSAYKAVTDGNDDADVREKLWSIVLLYHEFISYVRLYDSSVTARIVDKIQSLQADLELNIITPALKNIQQKGKKDILLTRSCLLLAVCLGNVKLMLALYRTSGASHQEFRITSADLPFSLQLHELLGKKKSLASDAVVRSLVDSLMVQRVQALEQEESTGVADRPELQSYFTFSEGMQEEALKVEWDGCVSHVDDERYQLSKLHQITHKSASLLPMMLEKNGADLPKLIVRVFAESDQKETPGRHTAYSVARHLLHETEAGNSQEFYQQLVCCIWQHFAQGCTVSPKKKKKTGSETLVPVLQSLGEEGISWTDLSHKVVKRVSGAVNAVLTDEKVLPVTLTKQQKLLQLFHHLPLAYLPSGSQLQCILGLLTLLLHHDRSTFSKTRVPTLSPEQHPHSQHPSSCASVKKIRAQIKPDDLHGGDKIKSSLGQEVDLTERGEEVLKREDLGTERSTGDDLCCLLMEQLDASAGTSVFRVVKPHLLLNHLEKLCSQCQVEEGSPLGQLLKKTVATVMGDFQSVLELEGFFSELKKRLQEVSDKLQTRHAGDLNLASYRMLFTVTQYLLQETHWHLKRDFYRKDVQTASRSYFSSISAAIDTIVGTLQQLHSKGTKFALPCHLMQCLEAVTVQRSVDAASHDKDSILDRSHLDGVEFVLQHVINTLSQGTATAASGNISFVSAVYRHQTQLATLLTADRTRAVWNTLCSLLLKTHTAVTRDDFANKNNSSNNDDGGDDSLPQTEMSAETEKSVVKRKRKQDREDKSSVSPAKKVRVAGPDQEDSRRMLVSVGEGCLEAEGMEECVRDTLAVVATACDISLFADLMEGLVRDVSVDNLANPAMIQEAVAVWQKVIGCSRLTNEQRAVLERLSVKYLLQCVAVMTEISCFFQGLAQGVGVPILHSLAQMLTLERFLSFKGTVQCLMCCSLQSLRHHANRDFLSSFNAVYDVLHAVLVHHPNTSVKVIHNVMAVASSLLKECIRNGDQDRLLAQPAYVDPMVKCANLVSR